MRNILIVLLVVGIAIIFSSCEKEYTCTCTCTDFTGFILEVKKTTITGKKDEAKDECEKGCVNIGLIKTSCKID